MVPLTCARGRPAAAAAAADGEEEKTTEAMAFSGDVLRGEVEEAIPSSVASSSKAINTGRRTAPELTSSPDGFRLWHQRKSFWLQIYSFKKGFFNRSISSWHGFHFRFVETATGLQSANGSVRQSSIDPSATFLDGMQTLDSLDDRYVSSWFGIDREFSCFSMTIVNPRLPIQMDEPIQPIWGLTGYDKQNGFPSMQIDSIPCPES